MVPGGGNARRSLPVNDCEQRAACFRGGLHRAARQAAPHLLYGSKELAEGRAPIFCRRCCMAPSSRTGRGRPADRPQQDMPTIRALEHARARWPAIQTGFDAGYPYQGGDGHGRGRFVRADGSVRGRVEGRRAGARAQHGGGW